MINLDIQRFYEIETDYGAMVRIIWHDNDDALGVRPGSVDLSVERWASLGGELTTSSNLTLTDKTDQYTSAGDIDPWKNNLPTSWWGTAKITSNISSENFYDMVNVLSNSTDYIATVKWDLKNNENIFYATFKNWVTIDMYLCKDVEMIQNFGEDPLDNKQHYELVIKNLSYKDISFTIGGKQYKPEQLDGSSAVNGWKAFIYNAFSANPSLLADAFRHLMTVVLKKRFTTYTSETIAVTINISGKGSTEYTIPISCATMRSAGIGFGGYFGMFLSGDGTLDYTQRNHDLSINYESIFSYGLSDNDLNGKYYISEPGYMGTGLVEETVVAKNGLEADKNKKFKGWTNETLGNIPKEKIESGEYYVTSEQAANASPFFFPWMEEDTSEEINNIHLHDVDSPDEIYIEGRRISKVIYNGQIIYLKKGLSTSIEPTHANLTTYTHAQLASFTHAQIASGDL